MVQFRPDFNWFTLRGKEVFKGCLVKGFDATRPCFFVPFTHGDNSSFGKTKGVLFSSHTRFLSYNNYG
jgi:hypothetical protein